MPWTEEPSGLPSMGSHRVRHNWRDWTQMHALEKEMATRSSVLAWRIPGTAEPGGLLSMGSHRVGHDWSELAAAAKHFLFIYLSLRWVFVAASTLSLVAQSSPQNGGLSLLWFFLLLLQSTGSRLDSVVVTHGLGLNCPSACGIFADQGWSLSPLHWQGDS